MLPEILSLLRGAFKVPAETPNLQPRLLQWKYYDPGPAWAGSRSYVIRKGDTMVAHACVWPIRLATPSGSIDAIQALDWAGAQGVPGAGVILMRKLEGLAQVLITCGGSEDTHQVLPQIGFVRQQGSIGVYARVLRPWRQFRTRPAEGRKAIPRLLRNAWWSRSPVADADGWTSQPTPPSAEVLSALDTMPAGAPESRYRAEFLEFMQRCPGARILRLPRSLAGACPYRHATSSS